MPADISYEETVIENNADGEKVRDAIVESIKKIDNAGPQLLFRIGNETINRICVR